MFTARNLEDALVAPHEVGELHLSGRGLTDFPMEVFQLPHLQLLDLSQNLIRDLPADIEGLHRLQVLNLRNNQLRALPEELAQLSHLQRLDLEENQLSGLPPELAHCDALRTLRLSDNCFEEWPAAALPSQLENLTLAHNQLREVPPGIRHLHALTYLDLRHNRLTTLPEDLALIEGLDTLMLAGNPLNIAVEAANPEGVLEQFFKELRRHHHRSGRLRFTPQARRCWLQLVLDGPDLLADFGVAPCVAALDAPLTVVREAAMTVLPQLLPSPLPASGPAKVVLLGQFPGLQRAAVEQALDQAGIQVLRRLDADPGTIVVLGERPGDALRAKVIARGHRLAFEGHLIQWWSASKGEYIHAAEARNPMHDNLGRLIRSCKKENIEIALMMMARGGAPAALLTDLLAVRLFHEDPEVRQKAAEAFAQLSDKSVKAFVDRQLLQSWKEDEYYDVQALVASLIRNPALDAGTLVRAAMALKGATTALLMLLPESEQMVQFQQQVKDGQLQLVGLGLTALPPGLEQLQGLRHLMLARNALAQLPRDLMAFAGLEMLDLSENHLVELPESIAALQALQGLDLSQNRLRHLPGGLCTLQSLEALRLDRNPLQGLPDAMARLPKLEMLGLYGCRIGTVPEVVWQMQHLRALDLGECLLRELPATIPGFPVLESLGLKDNPLQVLPDWIGALPALRFLDLSLVISRVLPSTLKGHPKLERIYLLRDDSMDWEQVLPVLASMPRLRYVYLRGKKIVRTMQLMIEAQLPNVRVFF